MADESAGEMGKPLLIFSSSNKNRIIEITVEKTATRESAATDCDSQLIMLRFPSVLGGKNWHYNFLVTFIIINIIIIIIIILLWFKSAILRQSARQLNVLKNCTQKDAS
jgi:hypothetical protein